MSLTVHRPATLGDALDASGVTVGWCASVVLTRWVRWIAWAVKLEQEPHRAPVAAMVE